MNKAWYRTRLGRNKTSSDANLPIMVFMRVKLSAATGPPGRLACSRQCPSHRIRTASAWYCRRPESQLQGCRVGCLDVSRCLLPSCRNGSDRSGKSPCRASSRSGFAGPAQAMAGAEWRLLKVGLDHMSRRFRGVREAVQACPERGTWPGESGSRSPLELHPFLCEV
jgi:hypothetical protein